MLVFASFPLIMGDSTTPIPFTDVTTKYPFYSKDSGLSGITWIDWNQDGQRDVIGSIGTKTVFYKNTGAGSFSTASDNWAGIDFAGVVPLIADLDKDGKWDATTGPDQNGVFQLYRGTGAAGELSKSSDALFTKVAADYSIRTWQLADYDHDGDLDILAAVNSKKGIAGGQIIALENREVQTGKWGWADSARVVLSTAWNGPTLSLTDANLDGNLDIISIETNGNWPNDTHVWHPAHLYLNDGKGGFSEVAGSGIKTSSEFSPFYSWDYDNDGDLDLINGSGDWSSSTHLYTNDGTGHYTESVSSINLLNGGYHHGFASFDLENDGDVDAMWVTQHAFRDSTLKLWVNKGGGAFAEQGAAWNLNPGISSGNLFSGGYYLDLDGDGDLDSILEGSNGWGGGAFFKVLQNNTTQQTKNNFLELELQGKGSSTHGENSSVSISFGGKKQVVLLDGGQQVHFGLGAATSVDEVIIRWSGGSAQRLTNIAAGKYTIVEGESLDTVYSSVTYTLKSSEKHLVLIGDAAINGTGNEGDNRITGNGASNALAGGAGNDTLQGGGGNDSLDGGTGADALAGDTGDDVYIVDDSGDVVTEDVNAGTDAVFSSLTYTLGANLENLTLTGTQALNATGNTQANQITGNAAANQLDGSTGADTLVGGAGNDTYVVDDAGDVVTEGSSEGTDTVLASVSYTLGDNVENLTLTGTESSNGTGNTLANSLTGNGAANLLLGGGGNDTLAGGAGNDTLNAGTGLDTVKGDAGSDLLQIDWSGLAGATISRSIRKDGAGAAASYSGSYTAKNSAGAVLSSVTFEGIESLSLNGKAVDLNASVAVPGVTLKRSSKAVSTTEQGGLVQYSVVLDKAPFEDVTLQFTSSDLTEGLVTTPSLVFTPQNWATPQALTIQGQDDYLDDGNIAYSVNGKIVTGDLAYNRLTLSPLNLLNNDDTEDKPINFKGTTDVDYFQGKNGDDRIYGGADQDQLKGGRGDDRIYGQDDNDRLFGELGNDELYGGYDDDTLDGGEGSDSLFGEQGRDTLIGGAGNDYLDGGLLNDSMSGGAGNDTYLVDSTGDVINDLGLASDVDTVQVIQTISYTLPANIENAAITASGNANLTGNLLNNGLNGNDGKNVLDGGVGNDTLDGGNGADNLLGGVGNDDLVGGAGNDSLRGGAGVDLADFANSGVDMSVNLALSKATGEGTDFMSDIENVLSGEGNDTLTGNALGNDLEAGAGIDSLNGGEGNDTLSGCFDGLNGGRGEIDTLIGGAGADVFQLGWESGRFYDDGNVKTSGKTDYVLITDFTPGQDKLQLDGAASGYYLAASGVGGVSGIGLFAEQGATDELLAIIKSANATVLKAENTLNTAVFV